ncbi:hypothetical protein M2474_000215 [Dysgonomonas sp. PH5-37]|nr:hypothetical protein [Dysgonomonas sp. PH5-37]
MFIVILLAIMPGKADEVALPAVSDSLQISVLTCHPWQGEVYAVFGHTAIRVKDLKYGYDIAFNYGVFDFSSPNFMSRFVKGETDYVLSAYGYHFFLYEYQVRGVTVEEQVLNLTDAEKKKLYEALCVNAQPENRTYRYSFFFDNCATRVRDIIEKNVDGKIEYKPTGKNQTLRDLLHEFLKSSPWLRFGIDLVIGSGADREITDNEKMFLPCYLMYAYSDAKILSDTVAEKPLVAESRNALEGSRFEDLTTATDYPLICGCLLFIITGLIAYFSVMKKKQIPLKVFSFILFAAAGAAGCVIFFLMFFSEHPCVDANWNLVWLNPLQLIFAFFFFFKFSSKAVYYYHFINFVALSLFLLAWFLIPQYLEIAFLPCILSLWLCSGANIWLNNKYLHRNK